MALCANSGPEQSQQSTCTESLLDHLVGTGEQRERDGEPNRVCSLHVNKQVVLRCLIDRNVPRRCAIKDLSNAPRRTGPQLHIVERVGHETTVFDILAVRVNCRQSILLGQLDDQSAAHPAFRFVTHIERVGVFLCHHLEKTSILCLLKGAFQPGGKQQKTQSLSRLLQLLRVGTPLWKSGSEDSDPASLRE